MSALWSATVIAMRERRVTLEVCVIHPDSGAFSDSRKFAFRLIYDPAYRYGPGLVREACGPLGEAVSLEQVFDDAFLAAHVDCFIARVAVSDLRNAPLDIAALRDDIDRELLARGVRRDDGAAWSDAWQDRWDAFWDDPARLPAATYEIEVTEPRWIAHLAPGDRWESAAY
jgi:hypothetical protein